MIRPADPRGLPAQASLFHTGLPNQVTTTGYLLSVKLKGIHTRHLTGVSRCMAGLNRHFLAAAKAANSKISVVSLSYIDA